MSEADATERRWVRQRFGTIDEAPIVDWLKGRGFALTERYEWLAPLDRDATADEVRAIDFLVAEWDYGAFVQGHRP